MTTYLHKNTNTVGRLVVSSYLLDLFTLNHRVVPPNLFRSMLTIIKRTVVFIAVTMQWAEKASTPAWKTYEANLLLTHLTLVLLLLSSILVWTAGTTISF